MVLGEEARLPQDIVGEALAGEEGIEPVRALGRIAELEALDHLRRDLPTLKVFPSRLPFLSRYKHIVERALYPLVEVEEDLALPCSLPGLGVPVCLELHAGP